MTSLARRKVSGSSAAARAQLVKGPTATMEMVLGSFSRRRRRISKCERWVEGVNKALGCCASLAAATVSASEEDKADANRLFQVSSGVR